MHDNVPHGSPEPSAPIYVHSVSLSAVRYRWAVRPRDAAIVKVFARGPEEKRAPLGCRHNGADDDDGSNDAVWAKWGALTLVEEVEMEAFLSSTKCRANVFFHASGADERVQRPPNADPDLHYNA